MKKIYKFTLAVQDIQLIPLPEKHKILCAQVQGNKICLWAEVEVAKMGKPDDVHDKTPIIAKPIYMFGTGSGPYFYRGDSIEDNMRYISTVQLNGYVWHIYE